MKKETTGLSPLWDMEDGRNVAAEYKAEKRRVLGRNGPSGAYSAGHDYWNNQRMQERESRSWQMTRTKFRRDTAMEPEADKGGFSKIVTCGTCSLSAERRSEPVRQRQSLRSVNVGTRAGGAQTWRSLGVPRRQKERVTKDK